MRERIGWTDGLSRQRIFCLARFVHVHRVALRVLMLPSRSNTARSAGRSRSVQTFMRLEANEC
jgi:hypothetical protein